MMYWCEVRRGGEWTRVHIAEALASHKGDDMRCIECGGRVWSHKHHSNGTPAHFEHVRANTGCSLIPYKFSGTRIPHPDALK
jgi:hypothetical protein